MADVKHDTKRSEVQLIGEVRIAYPKIHEKRTESAGGAKLDTPHYTVDLLLPKLGPAESCPNYKKLSDMAMEAATKAWAAWPDGGKWPVRNGDIPFPHKPKPGEKALTPEQLVARNAWRAGCWHIEATNYLDSGPKVSILANGVMQDIPAQTVAGTQLYKSGDFGYVSMNAYSFQNKTWGVNYGFEGVAYTRQGELIGGGPKSSAQMFAGIPVGAGAVQAAPPSAPPLPPVAVAPPLAPVAPSPPMPPVGAVPPLPAFPR